MKITITNPPEPKDKIPLLDVPVGSFFVYAGGHDFYDAIRNNNVIGLKTQVNEYVEFNFENKVRRDFGLNSLVYLLKINEINISQIFAE